MGGWYKVGYTMSKMKLIWIGTPADPEFDITAALAKSDKIDMHWMIMKDPLDRNFDFHMRQITHSENITLETFSPAQTGPALASLRNRDADLVVIKHPSWIQGHATEAHFKGLAKVPLVCWTWEWIPNIVLGDMPRFMWPRFAMANTPDLWRCQAAFPNKEAYFLPFGTYRQPKYLPVPEYTADLVADAQPHYNCGCFKGIKARSAEVMVQPVLGYDIALWGSRYGTRTKHDWMDVPKFARKVRGTYPTKHYPSVYQSSKIYLGVTWNWATGGYSTRLARALMSGIMVIWHDTLGFRFDIKSKEKIMEWSDSPGRTRDLVDYYLGHEEERKKVALAGQRWAVETWGWENNLLRLATEVQCRRDTKL